MSDLVCIATFRSRPEADFAKSMLDLEGIPAMIIADDAGGWMPHLLPGSNGAHLHVRAEDVERAGAILESSKAEAPV